MSSLAPELWSALGAATAIFFSSAGSCYASAKSGVFLMKYHSQMGLLALCPIIISGVLAIYGLIIGTIISFKLGGEEGSISDTYGVTLFGAGCVVGTACLCSGWGMGLFLDNYMKTTFAHVTSYSGTEDAGGERQPLISNGASLPVFSSSLEGKSYLYFLCIFVFIEAIGLYGLIVALFMIGK